MKWNVIDISFLFLFLFQIYSYHRYIPRIPVGIWMCNRIIRIHLPMSFYIFLFFLIFLIVNLIIIIFNLTVWKKIQKIRTNGLENLSKFNRNLCIIRIKRHVYLWNMDTKSIRNSKRIVQMTKLLGKSS